MTHKNIRGQNPVRIDRMGTGKTAFFEEYFQMDLPLKKNDSTL